MTTTYNTRTEQSSTYTVRPVITSTAFLTWSNSVYTWDNIPYTWDNANEWTTFNTNYSIRTPV